MHNADQFDELSWIGILSALAALTFTSPHLSGGGKYPELDTRITYCLEHLNYDSNHVIWGYATFALLQWQIKFRKFSLPKSYENNKKYHYCPTKIIKG